jgi:G3E family GTPase
MLTFYNPIFTSKFRLDTIVGVVDFLNFESVMDVYDIARHQIHFSNIVVITKSKKDDDLVQIKELISDINPKAIIIQDSDDFNTSDLLDKVMLDPAEIDHLKSSMNSDHQKHDENQDEHDHEPHMHEEVDHIFFQTDKPIDHAKFEKFIEEELPKNVIRAKGFVFFANAPYPDHKYLLQYVAGRKDWFRSEWDREKSTGILFVGKELDKEFILKGLRGCILSS